MFLFLDVVSPIPEFLVIEDNKLVLQTKIISEETHKLSDNIFEVYFKINKNLNLTENLEKIAITVGPGSYTSLRVGASFMSGLNISKELLFCPISAIDIIKLKYEKNKRENLGVYIISSNNQKFFCSINKENKPEFNKIEDSNFLLPQNIKKIFFNIKKLDLNNESIKQYKFSFRDELLENYQKLKFTKNATIKPIFISNNKILN